MIKSPASSGLLEIAKSTRDDKHTEWKRKCVSECVGETAVHTTKMSFRSVDLLLDTDGRSYRRAYWHNLRLRQQRDEEARRREVPPPSRPPPTLPPPSRPPPSRPPRSRPPPRPPLISLRQAKEAYERQLKATRASRKNIFFDDSDSEDDKELYKNNLRALLRAAKAWERSAENEPDTISGRAVKANSATAVKKIEEEIETARSKGYRIQIGSMAGDSDDEDDLSSIPVIARAQDGALPYLNLAL